MCSRKSSSSHPVLGFFTAVLLSTIAGAQVQVPPQATGPADHGDQYLLMFRPGTAQSERAAAARGAGALVRFNYQIVNAAAVTVPNANALAALQRNPSVTAVIPDRPVFAFQKGKKKPGGGSSPAPSADIVPAGVQRVGPPTSNSNGAGVGVAIVDTGIDFNHPDLAVASPSFTAYGDSCQDDHGHGTHVAGTVAALQNGLDVVGVAPQANLYCVKVLNSSGSGNDSTIIAGLDWIARMNTEAAGTIRVANMSLGRSGTLDDSPPLRAAVQALYSRGVVVVVAAGNSSSREVSQMVPAGYPEVLAVASTTARDGANACKFLSSAIGVDTASYFTTDGAFNTATRIGVTVSAPGAEQEDVNTGCMISSVGILSTRLGGGTTRMSGTSMAAPHVAGIVARLIQGGAAGVENIRSVLRNGAARRAVAPLDSPTSSYSFDGEREGVAQAP